MLSGDLAQDACCETPETGSPAGTERSPYNRAPMIDPQPTAVARAFEGMAPAGLTTSAH